ncbi:MAG: aquaporin Z [Kiritimatiellaeota bacterium]|nr:aquaporin Z [Kiritimatiellota bacterium]
MNLSKKLTAEFIGTFWLVLGGCGTAILAGHNVGWLGVSLAFGLTVVTMAFAIGHISGCHLNPAVSLGLLVGGRFNAKEFIPYVIAQVLGGIAAGALLFFILGGEIGKGAGMFATNFYGEKFSMAVALATEIVMTAIFLFVIMGATDGRAPKGFAPLAIGLCLCLIHLISIPVTNTSVNPARSTAVAVFARGLALKQLWAFWVAPLIGGAIGALAYRFTAGKNE